MDGRLENIWDFIVQGGIATTDELCLVTSINGTNEDSLNSVLYSRTGYRSMQQIIEMEGEQMIKYPKDDVLKDDFWIACPHCGFEMEMHERDDKPYGKNTELVPPHYCYPLDEDGDTYYELKDGFWIRY